MNTSINKTFHVEYPVDVVWANLTDPEKVVVCVPGASLTEKVDENNYKGEVELKFGPVKAGYGGLISFIERDAATHHMILKGAGVDNKGKGGADMKMEGVLSEKDGGTEVNVTMDVSVTGMLAQFGSRMINDVSNQVLDQFIANFKAQLSGGEVDSKLKTGSLVGTAIKSIFGGNKS
jgi:carbon monoxide dehydrogenase subunit G